MDATPSPPLLGPLFTTAAMAEVFSDRARLQGMLDFEAALARTQASLGLIPAAAGDAIAEACRADRFDFGALAEAAVAAGNLAVPMVQRLTALVAESDRGAAGFVHWGATSQDALDTGLVLQVDAAAALLDDGLRQLAAALAALVAHHAATPLIGRTLMQQAVPVTFGFKAAGWLSAVARSRTRLAAAAEAARTLQFGGAVGTLAALGDRGLEVAAALADRLGLTLPDLPWHGQRDRIADLGAALGLTVGTLGKIARDISLLAQTEVGEVLEPAGRGGSSTMPHKRNPVGCAVALAAAVRAPGLVATLFAAMPQENERGLGGWHAEWETLPELFRLAAGALQQMTSVAAGLEIDADRMRANLDLTGGLVMAEAVMMALAAALGRGAAHHLVEAACRRAVAEGRHLRTVLAEDDAVTAHLDPAALDRLFAPEAYLGLAEAFARRVLPGDGGAASGLSATPRGRPRPPA